MLNPQLLKIMIEMQGIENFKEEEQDNTPSGGAKRKVFELGRKKFATVPIRYND